MPWCLFFFPVWMSVALWPWLLVESQPIAQRTSRAFHQCLQTVGQPENCMAVWGSDWRFAGMPIRSVLRYNARYFVRALPIRVKQPYIFIAAFRERTAITEVLGYMVDCTPQHDIWPLPWLQSSKGKPSRSRQHHIQEVQSRQKHVSGTVCEERHLADGQPGQRDLHAYTSEGENPSRKRTFQGNTEWESQKDANEHGRGFWSRTQQHPCHGNGG